MLLLRADGYADNTIGTYRRGVSSLAYWLAEHDPEIGPAELTPDLVRAWLADIPSATAGSYIWGVRHFCRWLVAKGKADRDATEGTY
jgi:site-specific recombinase XerD